MKRFVLYISAFLFCVNTIYTQQIALYSQYFENSYIINPAVAGSNIEYSPFRLAVHKQWIGITESPSTQVFSFHHQLDNRLMGMGAMLFHDSFGPVRMIGVQTTYSYHLKVNRDIRISLGISPVFMQYILSLNQDDFYSYEPILTRNRASVTVPDANFGIYMYSDNYWAGFSAAHILQSQLKISGTWMDDSNKMVRHYFLMGGYRFAFPGSHIEIEPSALIKFTEITPIQVDVNMKVFFHRKAWAGVSVRGGDSFVTMFGINFDEYFFGFAHDFTFSDLSNHTVGSQELIFGWNIRIYRREGDAFQ